MSNNENINNNIENNDISIGDYLANNKDKIKDLIIETSKKKNTDSINRYLQYSNALKNLMLNEKKEKEDRTKKIKRGLTLLKDRYSNMDAEKAELKIYKESGCNSREDVIRLEILYIRKKLSNMKETLNIVSTLDRLSNIEESLDKEPLDKDRYISLKKALVIIEILNDLDVGLISVVDELYDEYVSTESVLKVLK